MKKRPSPRADMARHLRHEENLTYQEIADRMGITRQGAHLLVNPERYNKYKREYYHRKKGKL